MTLEADTNRVLSSHRSGGQTSKPKVSTACSLQSSRGESLLVSSSFWWLQVTLGSWQSHSHLRLCLHLASSSVCPLLLFPYKGFVTACGASPAQDELISRSSTEFRLQNPFPKQATFAGLRRAHSRKRMDRSGLWSWMNRTVAGPQRTVVMQTTGGEANVRGNEGSCLSSTQTFHCFLLTEALKWPKVP